MHLEPAEAVLHTRPTHTLLHPQGVKRVPIKPTEGEQSLFRPLGSATDALPRGRAKIIFKGGGVFLWEKAESRGHWPTAVTLRTWDRCRVAGTMVGLVLS